MKKRLLFSTILVLILANIALFGQSFQIDPNLPQPYGQVNDFANIIDDSTERQIEQKLRDFKAKTNPQVEIAVVTVKTTNDRPIFDYSLAIARTWKIGDKGATNSSALLLVAVDDRKYFTQVSGGLQDELPDGIVGQLQRVFLVPAFKQGNYSKGINDTIDAYIRTIEQRGDPTTQTQAQTETETKKKETGLPTICLIIICLIILFVFLIIIFGRRGGGGSGGSGGQRDRWRSGGFGGNTSNSSPPIIFWGGGGGSSSGSDWGGSSGGGDSWGGFGGGGGGFDGGGAGGDW